MRRFYISGEVVGGKVVIDDAGQLHHLKDVLRLKMADEVIVFDSRGNEYRCSITELDQNQAVLTVMEKKPAQTGKNKLTVACAIPKKAGMDDIIDSLTQLGVDTIIPMETERVIIRLDEAKKEARLERWRRIAQSAAQQSQRSIVPLIQSITRFDSVLAQSTDFDLKLIPTLSGDNKHVREVLGDSRPDNMLVLIGPEGDFTPQEIELAQGAGFIPVSLGDSVLRVGTAAIALASYIKLSLLI